MSKHIYTITAITRNGLNVRCFGYFFNETDARVTAFNNHGNLEECLYDYLVIEKQAPGIHALTDVVQWYYWHEKNEHWEECTAPDYENFQGITNWNGIG